MRVALFVALLCTALSADVVVLKEGGEKVVGRVTDKQAHVEVVTEQGLRTFLKDEVERIITSPQEFIGDSDKGLDEAKQDYQRALAITAPAEQNAVLKEAIAKLTKAREAYSTARELFPEDKYSPLDQKLMQVMQLMRLLRERVSSEIARPPAAGGPRGRPSVPRPPPGISLPEAFATLIDPAKRGDPARRKAAQEAFRGHRGGAPGLYDVATAAMLFLSKSDTEWQLTGEAAAALQDYFGKAWLKDPLKLTSAGHQEAATFIVDRMAAAKKKEAGASTDALALFATGHVGGAPPGPEQEKTAKSLGLTVVNGLPGNPEGYAVRDLVAWIASGELDLALRSYVGEYRSIESAAVRLAWSYAVLHLVLQKHRGFDRPISAFGSVKGDAAMSAHAAALVKSIQSVAPCTVCAGDGWLRCTNCHGQKTIYVICKICNGTRMTKSKTGGDIFCNACKSTGIASKLECKKCRDGYFDCPKCKLPACKSCDSSGRSMCKTCKGLKFIKSPCTSCRGSGFGGDTGGGSLFGGGSYTVCNNCKGSGHEKIVKCGACTGGFNDCAQCEPVRKPPTIDDICGESPCETCEGRGHAFRRVALTCRSCAGLGKRLTPKADPAKILPP